MPACAGPFFLGRAVVAAATAAATAAARRGTHMARILGCRARALVVDERLEHAPGRRGAQLGQGGRVAPAAMSRAHASGSRLRGPTGVGRGAAQGVGRGAGGSGAAQGGGSGAQLDEAQQVAWERRRAARRDGALVRASRALVLPAALAHRALIFESSATSCVDSARTHFSSHFSSARLPAKKVPCAAGRHLVSPAQRKKFLL